MENFLIIDRGATWTLRIEVTGDDNLPVDLTGVTARMQLRAYLRSPFVVMDLTTDNDRLRIDEESAPLGVISLVVDYPDVAALPLLQGVYSLQLEFPAEGDAEPVVLTVMDDGFLTEGGATR